MEMRSWTRMTTTTVQSDCCLRVWNSGDKLLQMKVDLCQPYSALSVS